MRLAQITTIGILFGTSAALGQSTAYTQSLGDGTAVPGIAPGAPAGSYALSGFESINLFNGKLSIALPLVEIKGRGEARYTMTLKLQSFWPIESHLTCVIGCNPASDVFYQVAPGWIVNPRPIDYSPGFMQSKTAANTIECGTPSDGNPNDTVQRMVLTRMSFTMPDGSEMELRDKQTDGKPFVNNSYDTNPCNATSPLARGNRFVSSDGSAVTFMASAAISDSAVKDPTDGGTESYGPGGVLAFPDGRMYHVKGSGGASGMVEKIIDRNGNEINFAYADATYPWKVTSITDSLGRVTTVQYGQVDGAGTYDLISFPGAEGNTRFIKVRYSDLQSALHASVSGCASATVTRTYDCLFPKDEVNAHLIPGARPNNPSTVNPQVVKEVELPDGRKYEFKYNGYLEVVRVQLPTGGAIEYTHAGGVGASASGIKVGSFAMLYRRLMERRVLKDGSTVEGKTVYSEATGTDGIVVTEDFQDAGGSSLSASTHSFYDSPQTAAFSVPYQYSPWKSGKEFKTEDGKISGGVFTATRRNEQTWAQRACSGWFPLPGPTCGSPDTAPPVDPRVTENRVTWVGPNQQAKQTFVYDEFNNKTSIKEYDFDGTTVLRETALIYETAANYVDPPASTTTPPPAAHLRRLVKKETIKNGVGATESETETFYDDQVAPGQSAESLDSYPAVSGLNAGWNSSYRRRGNVSWQTRWISASQGVSLTGYKHDIAGNLVKIKHPSVNTGGQELTSLETNFSYTDCYGTCNPSGTTKAFPTTVTRTAQPANHVTTAAYDLGSGKIKEYKDANGRATTFAYADALDRLTTVTHPIGTTVFEYGGTANNNLVRTKKSKGDGTSQLVTTETYFDGMGRDKQTLVVGAASVEKQYDAMGRPYRMSQPASGAATAWTETTFDELGRPVRVLTPDGSSKLLTHYNGKTTTASDEAGKWKRTEADGLGRLKMVTEDPTFSGLTILGTSYGNTSSFSPVAETIYKYDARNNLTEVDQGDRDRSFQYDGLSRLTSANNVENGIVNYVYDKSGNLVTRTDARFTTNFRYDKLSRLKRKEYTDTGTAAVDYCYDGDVTVGNGADCTGAPTASPASAKNLVGRLTRVFNTAATREYSDFDALGRVLASSQSVAGVTLPYGFAYQYNDIALKQMTSPTGKTWKYDYDAAGRPYRVSKDGATPVVYGEITAFAPQGAPVTMKLGPAGTGQLQQSFGYNSRQQPASMQLVKLTAPSTPLLKLEYFYCAGEAAACGTNNGNMVRQKISHAAPGETALNVAWDFTYDKVNRLEDFSEQGTVVESNRYDRYGNRWVVGAPAGSGIPNAASWFSATTNRMVGTGYDAAGNQTQFNPMTLVYDAENRVRTATGSDGVLYQYDGEGRRVKKVMCAGVVNCTEGTSGAVITKYVYDAAGDLTAEYQDGLAGGLEFVVGDHLGSTRVLASDAGEVVKRYDYRPFGTELKAGVNGRSTKYPDAGSGYPGVGDGRTVKFTGKERDAETGLDYFGARYFGAAQGRYISPDWSASPQPVPYANFSDPQTLNLYSYVRNNPLNDTDPDGHCGAVCAWGVRILERPSIVTQPLAQLGARLSPYADKAVTATTAVLTSLAAAYGEPNRNVSLFGAHSVGLPGTPVLSQDANPSGGQQQTVDPRNTPSDADYVVSKGGVAVPVDKSKLEAGLQGADVPNRPNTQTAEGGTIYDVNTANGPMPVRVMPGGSKNPPRVVMGTKESPRTPDGVRPKQGKEKDESHIVLK